MSGRLASRVAPLALALSILPGCAGIRLEGSVENGRYVAQDGRWSVALPAGFGEGFEAFAYDDSVRGVSAMTFGSLMGPEWTVVAHQRSVLWPEGTQLGDVADTICTATARLHRVNPERDVLVHKSSTRLAGRAAELRVYSEQRSPPMGADQRDLFRQEQRPVRLVTVFAVDHGPLVATFRVSQETSPDAYRFRPSERMVLEAVWDDLQLWMSTFQARGAPGAPASP